VSWILRIYTAAWLLLSAWIRPGLLLDVVTGELRIHGELTSLGHKLAP
jgi:hypothetical protein